MQFEFETVLSNGREVYCEGEGDILHNCDCCRNPHPHIQDLDFHVIQDTATGLDVQLTDSFRVELESEAEAVIYSDLEAEKDTDY